MAADTIIPVYRTIAGRHTDANDQPVELHLRNDLWAIRLRNGIEELEALSGNKDTVAIHDPQLCEWIKQEFSVEVFWYRFNTVQLTAIYSAVRVELWNKLADLDPVGLSELPRVTRNQILQPLPNAHWFRRNLRAFWRKRWKGMSKA